MARIIVTESASADQAAILDDLNAKAGARTAVRFRSLFGSLYDRLTSHPEIGALRPALGANIRVGVVWPYLVIYQYAQEHDAVTVLRIVHGRRKITGRMLGELK